MAVGEVLQSGQIGQAGQAAVQQASLFLWYAVMFLIWGGIAAVIFLVIRDFMRFGTEVHITVPRKGGELVIRDKARKVFENKKFVAYKLKGQKEIFSIPQDAKIRRVKVKFLQFLWTIDRDLIDLYQIREGIYTPQTVKEGDIGKITYETLQFPIKQKGLFGTLKKPIIETVYIPIVSTNPVFDVVGHDVETMIMNRIKTHILTHTKESFWFKYGAALSLGIAVMIIFIGLYLVSEQIAQAGKEYASAVSNIREVVAARCTLPQAG